VSHQNLRYVGYVIFVILLTGCSMAYDPQATRYVIFKPEVTERLLSDLSEVARAHRLSPWNDSLITGSGRTTHVLEAKGRALRIWATNVPLSGEEGCAAFPGMGSDPGQLMVTVHPALWWRDWDRALDLSKNVFSDLERRGYRVLPEPAQPCSAAILGKEVPGERSRT
jgi:hypothetical protein